jgi:type I restriction enzyme R subunit
MNIVSVALEGHLVSEITGDFFDRDADYDQWDRSRPHRHQPAAICFLTMRLNDSIPKSVVLRWHHERVEYLQRLGISVERDWKLGYEQLSTEQQAKFNKQFSRQRETTLDECLGACQLADTRARKEVSNSLDHFHGQRYWMGDYVIMPNHVHCLVAFLTNEIAKTQPGSWMRFSAGKINPLFGRTGALWFPEPFDHLVRNDRQLEYLRDYIANNPKKAKLKPEMFSYRRSNGYF